MKNIPKKFLYAIVCVAMLSALGATTTSARTPELPDVKTIHVSTTGTDASGCGIGTAPPCRSIQYAVNLATSGDTILVAKGTYTYNGIDPCTAQITRSVVCWWDKQLTIRGGYTDANWTVADYVNNLTIIDGGSQYRGVLIWHISGVASLNMEGFTIQNARATGSPSGNVYSGHAFGAGMWAELGSVNLKNMIFKNNTAVGGSNPSIAQAGWAFGGGLAIQGPNSGTSTLEKISFIGNQALGGNGSNGAGNGMGGGLMTVAAAVTAMELTFTNNLAKGGDTPGNACSPNTPGGGFGGAISIQNYNANLNFSFITATGNRGIGGYTAGANSCAGPGIGGVFFIESSTVNIYDSLLQANQASGGTGKTGGVGWAGGIYTEKVNLTLDRVRLIANTATSGSSTGGGKAGPAGGGGALLTAFDSGNYWANITNSLFAENKAVMGSGSNGTGGGGGLLIQAIAATITHSTFVNNKYENGSPAGQAILVIALNGNSGKAGSANIKYCVITDHQNNAPYNNSAVQIFAGNTGSLSYIWFGNNKSNTNLPAGTPTSNIWNYNYSAGYISPSSPNYDYHLQDDSPVIDLATGSPTNVDLDRQSRPVGPKADLGSYEYSVPTLKAEKPVLYAMTDTSAIVTLADLISVTTGPIAEWNATTSSNWVYLGPSGTSQQTTGQTGSNLTIRFDPSKIALGTYVVTINLTSNTANPTTITIYFYYVDKVEKVYLPDISR